MNSLVLLHGALGSAEDLNLLAKHPFGAAIRLYPFTFKGHGKKDMKGRFGIGAFSDELLAFISKENILHPFVFGYSMGGFVALDAALKAKVAFSGIITLGTKFKWSEDFTSKETAKLQPEVLLQKAPDFVSLLKQKHGPAWESLLSQTAEMMKDLQTTHIPFMHALSAIKIPVAIGRGDKDKMVTEEESRMAQQYIDGADYFELPESSHGFESINHNALAELIIDFMRKNNTNEAPANDSHRA